MEMDLLFEIDRDFRKVRSVVDLTNWNGLRRYNNNKNRKFVHQISN